MATRSDDTDAAQHTATPSRANRTENRNDNKPPKTPAAPNTSSSSSSNLPTPPSSGRSSHGTKHRRQSSSLRNAARAFLSLPPSPGSPPAAPSPPTTPSMKRPTWQSRIAAQSSASSSSSSATRIPSTPRIPREETPEVAPIPHDQQFCACCNNDDENSNANAGKGKQKAAVNDQQVVKCAVHGDVPISSQQLQQQSSRDREQSGSLTKVEAQLQAAKAYMMRRKQGSVRGGGMGNNSNQDSRDRQQGGTGSSR
ncbi:hypothetical protein SEUCBS140593_006196 [Sporothrix eucalyptigena]|uniref:Uncharacterized protein n=1 Tax=Sporothrix eucalyptigena TaxID=1812306 RepID=A0ABP0C398_9PEZI